MLRFFVLLLVLVNAVYFAWSQGMLRAYGWAPVEQSEPQRMQQQIRPELVRIIPREEARRADLAAQAPPPKPAECLMAGLFEEKQTEAVRKVLESVLPAGTWLLEPMVEPARWIVYMGKFPTEAAQAKKRAELTKLKVKLVPLVNPELERGLSMGAYETQAQAQTELANLYRKGVRTARVVQEKPEVYRSQLRIPAADEALRSRLEEAKAVFGDKALRNCK